MIDGLKPYPAMKDSGVPWLGAVPEHWEVSRLKGRIVRNGSWGDDADPRGTIVLRSTEQTIDGGWSISNPARIRLSVAQREVAALAAGDLVVTKSSGSKAHIGKASLVSIDVAALNCCFSNFMQRLRPNRWTEPAFLWRLLNCPVGRGQLVFQSTTTTGLGNLNGTILGNCRFAFPPQDEQVALVRFIDHADKKIRRYIGAKQKLIKLLEEQKQAIIHRAVTCGLDPNVRLKPSGVEWLGDVPEDWEVARLGRLIELTTGFPFKSEGFTQSSDDIRLLRGVNVAPGAVRWDDVVRWPLRERHSYLDFELRAGDIVLGMDRPIIHGGVRTAFVKECDVPSLLLQRVARIRSEGELRADFLMLLLSGKSFSDYLTPIFTGISVPHLSPEQIKSFRFALPGVAEQEKIVEQAMVNTQSTESAIDGARREISLLREFRTRLVADVVTGKLDIREAATKPPDEALETEPLDEMEELSQDEAAAEDLEAEAADAA